METIFINYDDVLIDKTDRVNVDNFYGIEPGGTNERKALSCVRYVLEDVLEWEPETAVKRFDDYMVDILKLDNIIRFIKFPPEVRYGDTKYILSLLYPELINLNKQKLAEKIYEEILSGKEAQFPRDYFVGPEGYDRFCSCLSYLLSRYKVFYSAEEVYQFLCSNEGKALIKSKRLKAPADQFGISILDAARTILSDDEDATIYYIYYALKNKIKIK